MAKKEKESEKQKKEKKGLKSSDEVRSRKRKRNRNKVSRYAGAIMYLVCLLIGLMLWVSGEVKTSGVGGVDEGGRSSSSGSSVIIVE